MLKPLYYIQKSISSIKEDKVKSFETIFLNNRKCYYFPSKSNKVILIVHGMSIYGIDDIRILKQARILNDIGFKVFLPLYPEVQQLKIDKKTVDDIAQDIIEIFMRKNTKIKIFSVSFSGGMSLLSSFRDETKDYIDSIYLVGSFFDIKSTLEHFFSNKKIDPYGYYIILKNFINFFPQYYQEEFIEALEIAIQDNALNRNPPQLPEYLQNKPHIKENFEKFLTDESFKKKILDQLLNLEVSNGYFNYFNISKHMKKTNFKISILHGKNDKVIPSIQAKLLFKECKKNNIPCRISVTSLLDHGNVKFKMNLIQEFYQLATTISFFLN